MFNGSDTEQKREFQENYEEPNKQEFNPYLLEPYALADKVDENETGITDLRKFIEA